jgi:surface protein
MAIRENVEEPEEITNQTVGVPGASCLFESELIIEERIYNRVRESSMVTCIDGYRGGGEWTCQYDGSFSGESCERISCEENILHKLGDDEIIILSGESLEVTCDDGYGDAGTWSCSLDGELTGNPCRKKCEEPVESLLGADSFVAYSGDKDLELHCNEGYFSENIYSCVDGEFSSLPRCIPVTCPAVSEISNALTSLPSGEYGDGEVIVSCKRPFDKNGLEVQWSCGSNGQWQGPACEYPHDCILAVDNLAGGFKSLRANRGKTLAVNCDYGYTANEVDVTCMESSPDSGVFGFDNIPTCEREPFSCELTVANSRAENEKYYISPGKSVLVSCLDGFYGGGKVDCVENGSGNNIPSSTPTCSNYARSTPDLNRFEEPYAENASVGYDGVICGDDTVFFPDHSFVFKVMLDADEKLKLPTEITAETEFYVDWGDSTCDHITNLSDDDVLVHEYTDQEDQEKRIRIIGSVVKWGDGESWGEVGNDFYKEIITHVINLGDVNWKNLSNAFNGATALESFRAKHTNTSNVTDMSYMFKGTSAIESLDLTTLNTSNVTTMAGMFRETSVLSLLDLSSFDTSKVTTMYTMFRETNLSRLDLSNFNTEDVIDMSHMFYNSQNLTSLDLSNFNTSKVKYMGSMFYSTSKIVSLDLTNFDTSEVMDMSYMFYQNSVLKTLDLSSFDTFEVIEMHLMFSYCRGLPYLDLSKFNTSNVTNMSSMFNDTDLLGYLDLGNWETNLLVNSSSFFQNDGSPIFSNSVPNANLVCLNNDDPSSAGNEIFIDGATYSCDGVAE